MYQISTTLLTAATMLAHGLFGCCWHHEHSSVAVHQGGGHVAAEHAGHFQAVAHQHEHAKCGHKAATGETPEAPCPHVCDGERCVFVRSSDSGAFDAGVASASAAYDGAPSTFDANAAPHRGSLPQFALHQPSSPAAPLHARLHVWLI